MASIKVLTIQLDVSEMSEEDVKKLQRAISIQCEDFDNVEMLNKSVREIDIDDIIC